MYQYIYACQTILFYFEILSITVKPEHVIACSYLSVIMNIFGRS